MKTICGIKNLFIIAIIAIFTTSCVQSTASSSSSDSTSATDNSATNEEEEEYTVTTDASTDVSYYDEEDSDDDDDLPGVAYSQCGIMYKQMNNDNTFFQDNDGDTLIVQQYSYDSAALIDQIKVNNDSAEDAYNTCLSGYIDSGVIYLDSATFSSVASNPAKPYAQSYSYEYCGYIAHTTYSSNNFTLLSISSIDFRVKNYTGDNYISSIPSVGSKISSENGLEACIYTNTRSYDDNASTFYDAIDAKVIDLGAYGIMK